MKKSRIAIALSCAIAAALGSTPAVAGLSPFLGQIGWVPYTRGAPQGWMPCDGRLLDIPSYDALFALLGTTYGGDGQDTFALPDVRGRVVIGAGQGALLSNRMLGETGGEAKHTLTVNELPAHSHSVAAVDTSGTNTSPAFGRLAPSALPIAQSATANAFSSADATTTLAVDTLGTAGSDQPHDNMQPYLTLQCIIAVEGIFPSQN
jgi:microcystin-dependent protein